MCLTTQTPFGLIYLKGPMKISPLAGKPAPASILVDINRLIQAYYEEIPDPAIVAEQISFGTSGHRGSSLKRGFNENHILAITQAICDWRKEHQINGPLFLGKDTHALSEPAFTSALEVLAANRVEVMLSQGDPFTPTPAISHAILRYNRGKKTNLADGIVITPSHNPPEIGGFKYNGPNGGPADVQITDWVASRANSLLKGHLKEVKKMPHSQAQLASTNHPYPYLQTYVNDLHSVIDMDVIRHQKIHLGVDPLGGAGVHYWQPIAETYQIDLTIVSQKVDPTFQFMSVDWDGQIRMDPSSAYAMQRLIGLKEQFQIAFACDTDHDRHGIVTQSCGLIPPNHYLCAAIFYLFQHRPSWSCQLAVGKTVVSSQMIDRVAKKLGRNIYEVPVGFKWFVEGLLNAQLGFVGEESAGASFLRKDGTVWTTDKDGIIPSLLAAEITAKTGKDPGELYADLTREFGHPVYDRIEASANREKKERLKRLSAAQIESKQLAGDAIETILTEAPGNGASIGGLKVTTKNGWFAARPSGTEELYKIYAESFIGREHLQSILEEAQAIVDKGTQ